MAQQQGGLVIALDGLEPESGEPQLWFIRDLLTGLTLRSGWLSQLTQLAFEDFLAPLRQLPWPILAVLSDKQTGLVPAVASVFPHSRHQCCQAHYLRNLAEPLTEADGALKTELRRAVRDHVGDVIRREPRPAGSPHGVLTVTGFVPDTNVTPPSSDAVTPASVVSPAPPEAAGDEVVNHLVRHTRYLLTLKGRPPFCLAGIETYERLQGVATLSLDLLTERLDMRLIHLYQGLKAALAPFADTYDAIQRGAVWLRDISDILGPPDASTLSAQDISGDLRGYINAVMHESDGSPLLHDFGRHLDKVSQSYWPGLFHCYDIPALARTNNEVESHFRDTQRRLLRTTGQKGQTRRTLHRLGAWELLPRPSSEAACVEALSHIPPKDFMQERQRVRQHRQHFRFQVRSLKGTNAQFERLRQQWRTTQKTDTG